ncbi:MAG: XrtB/PEP-CTERM-associated polysaccharide biosynthesis outer membrane protein EpsL [Pseudomonadota bacterium]
MKTYPGTGRGVLLAIACCACTSAAHGDAGDVFNVSVSQTLTHDDNLFRLPAGVSPSTGGGSTSRSDTISQTGVRLTADKPVGRQVLHAAIGMTNVRYDRHRQLDGELTNYSASWDWTLGHLWTGALSWSRAQTIPGFSDYRAPVRDIVTTDAAAARAVLRLHPDWRLTFGAGSSQAAHSASVNAVGDSRVDSAETGVRYVPGTGKEFGLRLRHAEGSYPNRQQVGASLIDNGYREDGLDFDVIWQFSGASNFQGAIGQTRRSHNDVPGRDFSGTTGRLNWNWLPTGQTSFGFGARREIGAQDDLVATYTVTDAITVSAGWQPTAKLSFSATGELKQRDQQGDPASFVGGAPNRRDDDRIVSLGVGYAAMRDLRLSLSLREERRESNLTTSSYRTRQLALAATFAF